MVCSKCQKTLQKTELATPAVRNKNEMYLGSPAGDKTRSKPSAASNTGISKNKLLSTKAKNPFAAYSSSCENCKTRTERGRKLCQRCAYKANGTHPLSVASQPLRFAQSFYSHTEETDDEVIFIKIMTDLFLQYIQLVPCAGRN